MDSVFEGRLNRKKADHGRFQDPYKERVYCWISASGVFCVCPTVEGSVARPGNEAQAAAERLDLKDFVARVEDTVKFSLAHDSRSVKFRADKPTELELWMKHLKAGAAAAQQRGAGKKEEALFPKEQEVTQWEQDVKAKLRQVDKGKQILLLQAAERGQIEQIRVLLNNGVSPNAAPEVGYTALMSASETGQLEVIKFLVTAKASVSARMEGGTSAVHLAAMTGNLEVVQLLCALDANVNDENHGGTTPLMLAAMEGHVNVCLKLHELGADVNAIESSVIPELEAQITELQDELSTAKREGFTIEGLQLEVEEAILKGPDAEVKLLTHPQLDGQTAGGTVALRHQLDLWNLIGDAYHAKHSQVNANQGAFDLASVNLAATSAIETFSSGLQDKLKHVSSGLLGTVTGNQSKP
jgi:hypothetical protein